MDKDIFEAMGKKPGSGKGDKQVHPLGPNKPKVPPLESVKEQRELMDQMKRMKAALEQQLAEVYSKGKQAKLPKEVLVESISQLPPELQDELRRREKELREKVKPRGNAPAEAPNVPGGAERRGKFRSARNKWIPMK